MRILFVAPSSYPIFGAEANVNAKVLKMLADKGHTIDLVCRTSKEQSQHYPISTNDIFFGKVNTIKTIDVKTGHNIKTIAKHLYTFLKTGYIYKGIDWAIAAINECEKLVDKYQYDYIYTYNQPSEVVGLYISKKYNIKWVATWNDPYMWSKYPAPYGKGINAPVNFLRKKMIADIGKNTYKNIFPSERLKNYMLKYMTNMKDKDCIISPHIIIEELLTTNNTINKNNTLKILHAGALGKERNPYLLLEGMRLFLNKYPNAKIEVNLLGVFERMKNSDIFDLIDRLNLNEYIKCIPPVTYLDSLSLMSKYDVCLLLEAQCHEGIFLPSKVADYMQNKKVIWTISPQTGVLNDLFQQGHIGYFSDNTSKESICNTLIELYTDYQQDNLTQKNYLCEDFLSKNVYDVHKTSIFH